MSNAAFAPLLRLTPSVLEVSNHIMCQLYLLPGDGKVDVFNEIHMWVLFQYCKC